jgi:small multidrug resistance family-3 protein
LRQSHCPVPCLLFHNSHFSLHIIGHWSLVIQTDDDLITTGANMVQSLMLFVLAGLCEIGGGYLVWLALREGKSLWLALLGVVILGLYGAIPTLQPVNFGRAYAAYGGIFIGLAILWGWLVDRVVPDRFDLLGAAIAIVGVFLIMYAPRP